MYIRGDQWPILIYEDCRFDPENPWKGLLRNSLLVLIRRVLTSPICRLSSFSFLLQAYKHVFTSPSSVEHDEPKATRSGNAHIHGMTGVTTASLAYISTQVRDASTARAIFNLP